MQVPKEKITGAFGKFVKRFRIPLLLIAAILVGYWLGGLGEAPAEHEHDETVAKADAGSQGWTCSMHPQIRLPKFGLCPICNMDLIPIGADTGGGLRQLVVSEAAKALMDIEVAPVERKFVTATVPMVGKVDYDETNLSYITAWIPGRLDRLFVDYTGVPVKKGDHMVYLYSPELISAQEEFLRTSQTVKNMSRSESDHMRRITEGFAKAAREKLQLLGLTDEQIAEIEQTGKVSDHMTIYAPTSGIVIHKNALEGMYVETGTKIYTIADLTTVWVKLDAYESDLQWLRYGQQVEFTTVSHPGETFGGVISFIDPVLDERTRTVKVRVNVENSAGKLKPGMFVKAVVHSIVGGAGRIMQVDLASKWICPMHPDIVKTEAGVCDICEMPLVTTESLGYVGDDADLAEKPMVIPAAAALRTGTRAIVYVRMPDTEKPTFEGREIVLGPRAGDYYLVRSGLEEGELVVTRGNFKIDSSLQLMAKPSMMTPDVGGSGDPVDPGALSQYQIRAVIEKAAGVQSALTSEDIAAIRTAFADLGETIGNVDMKIMTGDAHILWVEYRMRLNNDVVEGGEAKTLEDAQRAARSLAGNIDSLRSQLDLGQAADEPQIIIDEAFRVQLAKVFEAYAAMRGALADDESEKAIALATDGSLSLEAVDIDLLEGDIRNRWAQAADNLRKILTELAGETDIKSTREQFHVLSQQMIKVAKRFGSTGEGPIYVVHCPMAFDNRGADWLQVAEDIRNPYFGDAMLKCGGIEEVIGPKQIWQRKDGHND
jgi:Cu(I)/Ag(I) efflux system membrane fusion protein